MPHTLNVTALSRLRGRENVKGVQQAYLRLVFTDNRRTPNGLNKVL